MAKKKKSSVNRKARCKDGDENERELIVAEEGQVYGIVLSLLGNGRMMVKCSDGKTRLGNVCGWLRRRKMFVKLGDNVLMSLRECMTLDTKADVVYVYTLKEVSKLVKEGVMVAGGDTVMDAIDDERDGDTCDFEFERI
jgi:translation initiation factor 1A